MNRITVMCHYGCGTKIETTPQHRNDAVCEPCRKSHHQFMSNEARKRRIQKEKSIQEFNVEEWAYWGN